MRLSNGLSIPGGGKLLYRIISAGPVWCDTGGVRLRPLSVWTCYGAPLFKGHSYLFILTRVYEVLSFQEHFTHLSGNPGVCFAERFLTATTSNTSNMLVSRKGDFCRMLFAFKTLFYQTDSTL